MEGLQPLHRRVAGIDVHRMLHVATLLIEQADGSIERTTRQFGGFRRDCRALAAWLAEAGVELVVMEGTCSSRRCGAFRLRRGEAKRGASHYTAFHCNAALEHHMSTTALKDSQVSLRLPHALKDKMETYAKLTGRSKSHVAMEALSDYLDWRIPQIEDLKAAIAAADAGDFAAEDEVEQVFKQLAAPRTARQSARRR
jgi:predicted transcriptional regulator